VIAAARLLLPADEFDRWIMQELGFVELATVAFLIPAIGFGLICLKQQHVLPGIGLRLWIAGLTVGCFYFAGEELSWGQHLIGWQTPEAIASINDQQETNLHNMSSWLDQKPRLLLELWVLVGGVGYGGVRLLSRRRVDPESVQDWFWPTREVTLCAVLAIVVRIPERWSKWTDEPLPPWLSIRLSELQELFFATVLLIYLWSLARRLSHLGITPDPR
jgi:hypothetical protein